MSEEKQFVPLATVSDKRGLELFEEIVAEIEAHGRRTWNQTVWVDRVDNDGEISYDDSEFALTNLDPGVQERLVPAFDCGTVCCLFGHAAFKGGATFAVNWTMGGRFVSSEYVVRPGGGRVPVAAFAKELLGLPADLADWLSAPYRNWGEIMAFLRAWQDDAQVGPDHDENRVAVTYAVPAETESTW
jgi:hypothetical protein